MEPDYDAMYEAHCLIEANEAFYKFSEIFKILVKNYIHNSEESFGGFIELDGEDSEKFFKVYKEYFNG